MAIGDGRIPVQDVNGAASITVKDVMKAAPALGVTASLVETLGTSVSKAEHNGEKIIRLQDVRDPKLRPAHKGSMARNLANFSQVDQERLNLIHKHTTDGKISFAQLKEFQTECFHLDKPGAIDEAVGAAELNLLWHLFESHREKAHGTEVVSVDIIVDFLGKNIIPPGFKPAPDPESILKLVGQTFYHAW